MSDFVGGFTGGGNQTGTDTTGGTGNPLGDALSGIGSALVSSASASPANTVTDNPATTPAIDPALAAAASITPPASLSPQGDPTGIGGTLSDTQSGQPQKQTQPVQQPAEQFAPASAVLSLKKALLQIAQEHRNPYQPPASQDADPSVPIVPTGTATNPADQPALNAANALPIPQAAVMANPPLPPERPSPVVGDPAEARIPPIGEVAPAAEGRQINVNKPPISQPTVQDPNAPPPTPEAPQPEINQPTVQDPQDPPTKVPPPTKKPGVETQPEPEPSPPPPQFMGGGPPGGLPALARLAIGLMPLIAMLAGGGRRGRGGFNPFFHPGGGGHWPYFAPGRGWQMHGFHPGAPWRPMDPRHMNMLGFPGGGQPDFNQVLQAIFGNTQMGQANQRRAGGGGGYPPGMWRGGGDKTTGGDGTSGDYHRSGHPFTDSLTGIESPEGNVVSHSDEDSQGRKLAQGGDPFEISQGYFQIQNYRRGGTWDHYAGRLGIDLNKYPTPRSAPYEVQHQVAQTIPVSAWGHNTKAQLHQRFGSFPERWTLGQLEDYFGRGKVAQQFPQQRAAAQ